MVESRTWHCHNCPLVLTEKSDIRLLDPCGHIFCFHCTLSMTTCVLRTCQKRVNKVITPKIEEGEPIDEKEEVRRRIFNGFCLNQNSYLYVLKKLENQYLNLANLFNFQAEKQRLERRILMQKIRDCNERINRVKGKRRSQEKNASLSLRSSIN